MKKQIRVLIVEDSEDDAKLIVAELERADFEVGYERVETSAAMRTALERELWDVILCDFTMPYFSGDAALRVAKQFGADVPFIYVSGTIGEDIAIEAMKSGAQDYVMKSNLTRLVPAIQRVLQEASVRRDNRRAEAAMRESEDKYRHLFEALGDAVFLLDDNTGEIVDTNTQAEALLGLPRAGIVGANLGQFLASGQPGIGSLRAAAGERQRTCELELRLKDGGGVPVQASASHIELRHQPLLLAVLRDVTERNRMEEQLRQLSRAMEQSPASIVITDTEGNIRYVNAKFMALTGYSFNEVYGKNPRILKSGRVSPEIYQEMWTAITAGKEWHGQFQNKKKNGELYWEAASISPIVNEQGLTTHFLAVKEDITGRKQMEEALRQSQERYQALADNSLLGIAVMDTHYRIITVNATFAGLFKKPAAEFVGKFCFNEFEKRSEACLHCPGAKAMASKCTAEVETQGVRDDGSRFYVRNRAVPIFAPDGVVSGFIEIVEDIDTRKRVEQALQESEERHRLLFENSKDAFMTVAPPDWRLVSVNPSTLAMFRARDVSDFLAKGPWEFSPETQPDGQPSAEKARAMIGIAMRDGSQYFEWTHRRLDGELFPATVLLTRMELKGQLLLNACVRDITDLKRAEESLRDSEERFRSLVETSSDWIWETNEHMAYAYASPKVRELLGYEPEELQGKTPFDLMPADEAQRVAAVMGPVVEQHQPIRALVNTNRHKDGRLVVLETSGVPVFDAAGAFRGYRGMDRDITERNRAVEALAFNHAILKTQQETSLDGILVVDEHARFISFNQRFVEMWGLPREVLATGDDGLALKFVAAQLADPENFLHQVGYLYEHKDEKSREEIRLNDGKVFDRYSAPMVSSDGRYYGRVWFFRDITERRRGEEMVQESDQRVRLATEATGVGIWEWNLANNNLHWDAQMFRIYGLEPAPDGLITYKDWSEAVLPEDFPKQEAALRDTVQRLGHGAREFRIRRRGDGQVRFIQAVETVRINAQGQAEWVVGTNLDITDRKQAEAALARERQLLRMLILTLPDAIYFKDRDSRFTQINPAQARHLGLKEPPDAVGKTDFDFFDEEHARRAFEDEQTIIRTGQPMVEKEEKETWPDGRITWVATTKMPLRNDAGEIIGTFGVSRDITERKRTEALLQESEAKFRALFEMSWDAIMVSDQDGFIDCNEAAVRLFGYSTKAEILGKQPGQLLPTNQPDGEDSAKLMKAHADAAYSSGSRTFECYHQRKDGSLFPAEIVLNRVELNGQMVIQGVVRDITERKQAEEKIREQAALLDKAQDAIFVLEPTGRITYWSQGATRRTGWTSDEAIGKNAVELMFQGNLTPQLQECIKATQQHGEWIGELEEFTKDGRKIIVQGRANLIRDDQGRPKAILIFDTDITEKKKLEAQFLRSQRMESLGTLASGIAHDLNNVLAPILIALQLMEEKLTDLEGHKLLETLEANVRRGAELIKQVLAFGRGMKGERITVQPGHIMREIKQIVRETFPKSIAFELHCPPDLWTLTGDPTQIHQILLNLCVNARDAMPVGGKLSLQAENLVLDQDYARLNPEARPGPYIVISVRDTGTGIPREIQERIFEPFFTTKGPGRGSGLGLSTTLAISRSHGGFVHCYSEVGKGSTFKVYLPADVNAAAIETEVGGKSSLPSGHNELVLVVDDELAIRQIAQRTLERFGYRVLLAANGSEAVEIYTTYRQDVAAVITDMAMPVMDGRATVAALKSINPEVKIIGSSGLSSGTSMVNTAEVMRFISKPFTSEVMLRALDEILHPG